MRLQIIIMLFDEPQKIGVKCITIIKLSLEFKFIRIYPQYFFSYTLVQYNYLQ